MQTNSLLQLLTRVEEHLQSITEENVSLSCIEMCAGVTKWQRVAGFTWLKQ